VGRALTLGVCPGGAAGGGAAESALGVKEGRKKEGAWRSHAVRRVKKGDLRAALFARWPGLCESSNSSAIRAPHYAAN